ncbi:hypothetical protein SKAU_G00189090 [Synaphobranchus kaupii]|uniref:Uncharacterized protein n=1 Tax=Synaphobranchus kaupii TaxID=118154 RepID=A0A9Q1FD34_SYNKA|nr:hypothetical protein SKAU_G00189090 [Synaphobranchus kaupii]
MFRSDSTIVLRYEKCLVQAVYPEGTCGVATRGQAELVMPTYRAPRLIHSSWRHWVNFQPKAKSSQSFGKHEHRSVKDSVCRYQKQWPATCSEQGGRLCTSRREEGPHGLAHLEIIPTLQIAKQPLSAQRAKENQRSYGIVFILSSLTPAAARSDRRSSGLNSIAASLQPSERSTCQWASVTIETFNKLTIIPDVNLQENDKAKATVTKQSHELLSWKTSRACCAREDSGDTKQEVACK